MPIKLNLCSLVPILTAQVHRQNQGQPRPITMKNVRNILVISVTYQSGDQDFCHVTRITTLFIVILYFQGLMHVNGRPVAAFDPEGLIFGAGIDAEFLKLYDLRSFDRVSCFIFNTPYIIKESKDYTVT